MVTDERESRLKRHPIQVVARRTGLTADVLRAWEKRYGVVKPGRSEGGRRLYSDADIERLRLLRRASLAGRRIGQIASLSTEELTDLVQEDEREEAEAAIEPGAGAGALAEAHLQASLAAMERLDARELEAVLNRALVTLSAPVLVEQVAAPVLRRVGELWSRGGVRPAHEHLASAVLLRVLGKLVEAAEPSGAAPKLVVATPAGQQHEFGALFAAATAAAEGWHVTYLGSDLPAEDIAAAASETGAEAVALSIVYVTDQRRMEDELRTLRRRLQPGVPILVGGAAIASYKRVLDEIGARQVSDMVELRSTLAELS
jgi:DNA-binding transcriptional MerR regulator/methylmalonyl-CoA mutase cobalamin-binding subunit